MNIRPKIPLFLYGGNTGIGRTTLDWYNQIHKGALAQHILDMLSKYGEANDYGFWLNDMQHAHSQIRDAAGNPENWRKKAYSSDAVKQYLLDYLGNGNSLTSLINNNDLFNYNTLGILNAYKNNVFTAPGKRMSGDNPDKGYNADGLYSSVTDWRYLLGRKGDWGDETSEEFKQWQKELNARGWETYLDKKEDGGDDYYKLRRLAAEPDKPATLQEKTKVNETPVGEYKLPESIWTKLGQGLNKVAPDLLDALRLAGNMYNNDRVYKESMKAIRPNLLQSYHTYRQVVGDEATKQGFYRRATQGELGAARPITSDLDKLIAYQNEAKRIGDELRAQGDLADNLRIRETSTESDAHTDANKERDTTLANSNLTEILKADAAKHQLTALKYSADWTNLEQFLLGKQLNLLKDKAKDEELKKQLSLLDALEKLIGDTKLRDLKTAADEAYDAYYQETDATKKAALKQKFELANNAYLVYKIGITRENLKAQYVKEGTKITKKHKDTSDKFLYKTSRDIVEHFRKMSKMTDDSRIKTLPKPIKLTSHPRKMLLGGVAPFTVYRPLGVGGENAVSTQTTSSTDSKSSKDTAAKDKLDMIKELFKAIQGQGLPIDVSTVYQEISGVLNKAKAFGEELTTDDIASMYLSSMLKINNLKYSKDVFDKAKAQATTNEALNEFAVTTGGKLVLQDREGKITTGTYADYVKSEGRLNPITNDQLLNLRAYSPDLALWKGDELMLIVNNGVGMNKIAAQIKSMAASIGSMENKIEGISQVESNKIKAGLQILAGVSGTPDGYYKVTTDSKDSKAKVAAALDYIMSMLPNNYKAVLEIHSGGRSKELIANFLTSQTNDYIKLDISPLTGQASSKKDGSGSGNDMLPSVAFFNGLGEKDQFIILDKTSGGLKISTISTPITSKGYNTGSITFNKLESSDFGGQLLMNQATMGDALISSVGRNNIIIDGRIYQAELPIDKEAKAQGIIKPDLKFLKKIEEVDLKLKSMGIDKNDPSNIPTINKVYQENNLPILYTISGNKPTLTSDYARFAIVNGVGTEDAFGENPEFNDGIKEITGSKEREQFETLMKQLSGNAKYKLDNGIGFLGMSIGETKLYQGTIYIPMVTSNISALAGTGYRATGDEYNEIESRLLAADAARELGFNPAGNTLK